ncbi:MAG: phenylalanine--tRNA ligase subunit beta, partial [Anaerolineae bacterium]|nr:phenylalanine--tRNA ligase subunit beta [Anaerolineae bacterium]
MKAPIKWLKDYVDITIPIGDLIERLTLAGLEVGAVERIGDWWDREKIVVGEVLGVRPHPDADRLVLADVAYGGDEIEQCVTGAPNLFPYKGAGPTSLKVAFAMEGAELYDGHQEGFVKMRLKRTKIRGVPSRAMVCSEKELGLSDAHEGIMFLPPEAPVGMPLADYLGDVVLDLDLTPNLARAYNMLGVAREVAALTGQQVRYPDTSWTAKGPPAADLVNVVIQDPDLCARFTASVIRDVEIGPAPAWMQDRVRLAGMRPISNIVDITNYVMLEYGQPLHAFDYDKLVARAGGGKPTIIVRCAYPGETMMTLDNVLRTFSEDTLLITDTAGPIGIAGVMGGLETEIDDNTRNILLEAANFDFISIRRTAQELKLPSEAAARFGRGIHPTLAELGSRRASELMRQLARGTISRQLVDTYPVQPVPAVVELTAQEVMRNLGIEFDMDEVRAILESLEFKVERVGTDTIRATVPDHRLDVEYPADLIEEVARIYG